MKGFIQTTSNEVVVVDEEEELMAKIKKHMEVDYDAFKIT